jgi:hypothetical protein
VVQPHSALDLGGDATPLGQLGQPRRPPRREGLRDLVWRVVGCAVRGDPTGGAKRGSDPRALALASHCCPFGRRQMRGSTSGRASRMRPAAVLLAAARALALAAPRATSAAEACDVVNRGWLDGVFNERIHPTYLFGPGGLHGRSLHSFTFQLNLSRV